MSRTSGAFLESPEEKFSAPWSHLSKCEELIVKAVVLRRVQDKKYSAYIKV